MFATRSRMLILPSMTRMSIGTRFDHCHGNSSLGRGRKRWHDDVFVAVFVAVTVSVAVAVAVASRVPGFACNRNFSKIGTKQRRKTQVHRVTHFLDGLMEYLV